MRSTQPALPAQPGQQEGKRKSKEGATLGVEPHAAINKQQARKKGPHVDWHFGANQAVALWKFPN